MFNKPIAQLGMLTLHYMPRNMQCVSQIIDESSKSMLREVKDKISSCLAEIYIIFVEIMWFPQEGRIFNDQAQMATHMDSS